MFVKNRVHGGAMVSTVASQQDDPGIDSRIRGCVEFGCSPCVCVSFFRYSCFLQQSKDVHIRLTVDSKVAVGVNGSLSLCVRLVICTVYGSSHPGICSSPLATLNLIRRRGWMLFWL